MTTPLSDADNPILRPHEDFPLLLRYQTTDGEVIGKATLHPDGSVTADPWTGPPTTILAVSVWTPTFRELEAYERAQRRKGDDMTAPLSDALLAEIEARETDPGPDDVRLLLHEVRRLKADLQRCRLEVEEMADDLGLPEADREPPPLGG